VRRVAVDHAGDELPHGTAWRGVEAWRAALVEGGGFVAVDLRTAKYEAGKEQARAAAAAQQN
jgi:hypothetical protein